MTPFYLRVKVAVIAGVILSSPIWLYQIWAFVAPGLYAREKRWSYLFLGTAVPLFLAGVTLAYWSLGRSHALPARPDPGPRRNLIQVDQYMSFVMTMLLAFGIAFEVPLLIIMLNLAGLLTHERFRKWRRVMIFGVFLIAGMANPSPDPITMLILGGACAVLVEVAEFDRVVQRPAPGPAAPRPLRGPGRRRTVPGRPGRRRHRRPHVQLAPGPFPPAVLGPLPQSSRPSRSPRVPPAVLAPTPAPAIEMPPRLL